MRRWLVPVCFLFVTAGAAGVFGGCTNLTAPPPPEAISSETPSSSAPPKAQASAATALPTASAPPVPKPPEKVTIKEVAPGKGPAAKDGDLVGVLYTGKLQDGSVFDASAKHNNKPFSFTLGRGGAIEGWQQGISGMKVGGKRQLTIPPSLAYGDRGIPGVIPPNATLLFDVELKSIAPPKK